MSPLKCGDDIELGCPEEKTAPISHYATIKASEPKGGYALIDIEALIVDIENRPGCWRERREIERLIECLDDFVDRVEEFLYVYNGQGEDLIRRGRRVSQSIVRNVEDLLGRLESAEIASHEDRAESTRIKGEWLRELEQARVETVRNMSMLQAGLVTSASPRNVEYIDVDMYDGFFVYILWGHAGPLYVGQSTNLLARLGSHMSDSGKRSETARIQLIRCADVAEMSSLERELIELYRPRLNKSLNPDAKVDAMLAARHG